MNKIIVILLLPGFSLAQITIIDGFNDGNFSVIPTWTGDVADFQVNGGELQMNNIAPSSPADTSILVLSSKITDSANWKFYFRFDQNLTSSNYASVYLISNQANLKSSLNGYFLRFGASTSDKLSLYRQDGTSKTLLTESSAGLLRGSTVEVRVEVRRDSKGLWTLKADTGAVIDPLAILDTVTDQTYNSSAYFGLFCRYTTTRADKFFFDDFDLRGKEYKDLLPPTVDSLRVITNSSLEIFFSESVVQATANNIANYRINNGIGSPAFTLWNANNPRKRVLFFINTFQNKIAYELYVQGVEDLFDNSSNDTVKFSYFLAEEGDVVINEIMPDPSPSIGIPPNALPEREYLELYNRTDITINLRDWTLNMSSIEKALPTYFLEPDSFVMITKDKGANEFPPGLPILGLDIPASVLTNSGNTISLQDPSGKVISTISYADDWYNDLNKDDGGWSIEQVDAHNFCGGIDNWRASIDPIGGTPGRTNSVLGVNPDTVAPAFERIALVGDNSIVVFFTEKVDLLILERESNYLINPPLPIDLVEAAIPSLDQVEISFSEAIDSDIIYTLTLDEYPLDCNGNPMEIDTLIFALPKVPEKGNILINEILFNPSSGGSDFVELYNYSNKVFDLSKLRLCNWDAHFQVVDNVKELRDESFLFEPGHYLALTIDAGFFKEHYILKDPDNVIEVFSLPSMPDSEGSIAIATSNLQAIDYFEYRDDLHLAVINDDEGVSLERISFNKPTTDEDNWQSAASTTGYATPGYQNSQYFSPRPSAKITLDPKVFSPNQDGYHDILTVNYWFDKPNNVVSVSVWNSQGYEVKELVENENVSQTGFFVWDGVGENSQLQNSGIYIVVVDFFNEDGTREVIRKTCVLSL